MVKDKPQTACDFKALADCSKFHHLVIFKKLPLTVGSRLLHIPTTNYKYDLYFHLYDENTIKVSLWRYFSSEYYSEQKDSFLISSEDYISNISHIDNILSGSDIHVHTNCAWLDQPVVQSIFKHYKSFALTNAQMSFNF